MKYIVKAGSLGFEQGTFQRGDVIELTKERAAQMDPNDIQLIPDNIEDVKTIELSNKKRVFKKAAATETPVTEVVPTVEEAASVAAPE